ncbi:MAG: hypothetical protein AVDCRST_MAG51-762, partial [uncultured Ramlibacter sp.]
MAWERTRVWALWLAAATGAVQAQTVDGVDLAPTNLMPVL